MRFAPVSVAAIVVLALVPVALVPAGGADSDATALRSCKTVLPAPANTRCTLLVGTGHLGVVGAGFTHSPCFFAAATVPCYVGTMKVELTWSGGAWSKTCNQVQIAAVSQPDVCTSAGVKPPAGTTFALICQSYSYSAQNPPAVLMAGGTGPVGCWITISV